MNLERHVLNVICEGGAVSRAVPCENMGLGMGRRLQGAFCARSSLEETTVIFGHTNEEVMNLSNEVVLCL